MWHVIRGMKAKAENFFQCYEAVFKKIISIIKVTRNFMQPD